MAIIAYKDKIKGTDQDNTKETSNPKVLSQSFTNSSVKPWSLKNSSTAAKLGTPRFGQANISSKFTTAFSVSSIKENSFANADNANDGTKVTDKIQATGVTGNTFLKKIGASSIAGSLKNSLKPSDRALVNRASSNTSSSTSNANDSSLWATKFSKLINKEQPIVTGEVRLKKKHSYGLKGREHDVEGLSKVKKTGYRDSRLEYELEHEAEVPLRDEDLTQGLRSKVRYANHKEGVLRYSGKHDSKKHSNHGKEVKLHKKHRQEVDNHRDKQSIDKQVIYKQTEEIKNIFLRTDSSVKDISHRMTKMHKQIQSFLSGGWHEYFKPNLDELEGKIDNIKTALDEKLNDHKSHKKDLEASVIKAIEYALLKLQQINNIYLEAQKSAKEYVDKIVHTESNNKKIESNYQGKIEEQLKEISKSQILLVEIANNVKDYSKSSKNLAHLVQEFKTTTKEERSAGLLDKENLSKEMQSIKASITELVKEYRKNVIKPTANVVVAAAQGAVDNSSTKDNKPKHEAAKSEEVKPKSPSNNQPSKNNQKDDSLLSMAIGKLKEALDLEGIVKEPCNPSALSSKDTVKPEQTPKMQEQNIAAPKVATQVVAQKLIKTTVDAEVVESSNIASSKGNNKDKEASKKTEQEASNASPDGVCKIDISKLYK